MEDIINIGISDIIGRAEFSSSFADDIIVIDLKEAGKKKNDLKHDTKLRFEAISILVMLEGEIDININGNDYHFDTPVILDILELHVFKNVKIAPNTKGYHIIISEDFIKESMQGIKHIPFSDYISRFNYPIEHITPEQGTLLHEIIFRIQQNISRQNHCHHRELIKNELRSLLMEITDIVIQKNEVSSKKVLRNKNEIIKRFMNLLSTSFKEEHSVEYYANELCIDPKYLSRILKSLNGKPAGKWIDEVIINEAQMYLRNNELSIQQIADKLNFSDQSSFGKFFKKNCGVSPLNFRNKRNN
ncbi:MAG: helix-turn-helix domain-containing protein [Rikenellaceae bacterium]